MTDPVYSYYSALLAQAEMMAATGATAMHVVELIRSYERSSGPKDEAPRGHGDALEEIARHVRQIEIIADAFGYDPYEWLADDRSNATVVPTK